MKKIGTSDAQTLALALLVHNIDFEYEKAAPKESKTARQGAPDCAPCVVAFFIPAPQASGDSQFSLVGPESYLLCTNGTWSFSSYYKL